MYFQYGYGQAQNQPETKPKSSSTADTIGSAVSTAIQLYTAYQEMKSAPQAVPPNRSAFSIQPTASMWQKKEGY